MNRLRKLITHVLSIRISLMVVLAATLLLSVALFVMFRFSRRALRQEALEKANQTLNATVQHTDNVLLTVEQSAGNIYWDLIQHLDQPDRMFTYSQKLVESIPYITGCAIAMEPDYYKNHGKYFMAYAHRDESGGMRIEDSPIIQSETFGNVPYNEQSWYTIPMQSGHPCWIDPLKDYQGEAGAIISFCLPIYDKTGQRVGVMGTDVSLSLLSKIVQAAKPSPNSYATLLGSDGSFIVHPDSNKLMHETVFMKRSNTDPEMEDVARAMVAGERGYRHIKLNGTDSYIFYQPFTRQAVPGRSMNHLNWSAGIIYPEEDIFGDYNQLLYTVLTIAIISLVVLLILCQVLTHRLLLPLRLLNRSAQRIAEGDYNETIPESRHHDEVGQLQTHFHQMQQALASNMGELKRLNTTLLERGARLSEAYEQAKEADRMKTAVLHNMTNQMIAPVNVITDSVDTLCRYSRDMGTTEVHQLVENIQQKGQTVTDLLNDLLEINKK